MSVLIQDLMFKWSRRRKSAGRASAGPRSTGRNPARRVSAAVRDAVESLEGRTLLAAVTFPQAAGLEFHTSSPSRPASNGDWYTAEGTGSTDAAHYYLLEVTAAMLSAGAGTVNVTVNDADTTAGGAFADETNGTPDPARFDLLSSNRFTVLSSTTVPSTAPDNTPVGFAITTAGTYYVRTVTGARPISGDTTADVNDDDNAYSITVSQDGGLLGQYQATFRQSTVGSRDMYFLVGLGTTGLYLRNFDLDGSATVTYTRPSGATVPGTASGNGFWNGPGPTPNTGGDEITGLTAADAGLWKVTFGGWDADNQAAFEPNAGSATVPGARLVVLDAPPASAGNFTLAGGGTLNTPVNTAADHGFTVTNNYASGDVIELTTSGTSASFTAQLLTAGGAALTDTTGDGAVDTGVLAPGESRSFILRVTPTTIVAGNDTTRVSGVSVLDRGVNASSNAVRFADFITRRANAAPTHTVPAAQTIAEDGPARVFSSGNGNLISVADADLEGGIITVTLTATNGVVTLPDTSGLSFATGDGTADATMSFGGTISSVNFALNGLSFRTPANFNGAASLRVFTSDNGNTGVGGARTDDDTVAINVTPANDPPVNSVPGARSTAEDTPITFSTAGGNAISVSDVDGAALPLRVTLAATDGTFTLAGTAGLAFQAGDGAGDPSVTFTGSGTDVNAALNGLTFTPAANFNGVTGITVTTDDLANGGAGGAMTDADSVTVNVSAANDAPVNAAPAAQSVAEDATLTFSSAGGNALAVADPDGANVAVRVTVAATDGTLTLSGTNGLTFEAGDGTDDAAVTFSGAVPDVNAALAGLLFAPAPNFHGAATVTVTTDDLGNVGAGGAMTDADVVAVTVTSVNDVPVAGDDSVAMNEDGGTILIDVLANDADAADGDALTLLLVSVTGGTAALHDNGTPGDPSDDRVAFTPAANFHGTGAITYSVSDGNGGTAAAVATVAVASVPDAPVAADDAAVLVQDTSEVVDVLANDTDADGDIRPELTAVVAPPTHGAAAVDPATGRITYTPEAGYAGVDELVYQVTDDSGETSTASVSFSVSGRGMLSAAASDIAATAGEEFSGTVGTFVLPGGPTNPGAYDALINWGDGHTTAGVVAPDGVGGFTVDGLHAYDAAGDYALILTVMTTLGRTSAAEATARVAAPVPPEGPSVVSTVLEKLPRRIWRVTGVIENPLGTPVTLLLDWGDQTTSTVEVPAGETTFVAEHQFRPGARRGPVTVTIAGADPAMQTFRARTENETWVVDLFHKTLGREVSEKMVTKLGKSLDRARSRDVARQRMERRWMRLTGLVAASPAGPTVSAAPAVTAEWAVMPITVGVDMLLRP